MKVRIHKYPNYIGPYQIFNKLENLGIAEDKVDSLVNFVCDKLPKVEKVTNFIHKKRIRKDKIVVEYFDVWSADVTLAKIIVPVLEKLKQVKHGAPFVDNEDVPEEYRVDDTDSPDIDNEAFQARWDWVLDKMIQGFRFTLEEFDGTLMDSSTDEHKIREAEAAEGRRLFAKYYGALWD